MLITTTLSNDFLPSSYGYFLPTIWDVLTYVGSLGFFFALLLLFLRFFPLISMSEMRSRLPGMHGPEVGR
jgi:molybdopterin-containing oxidoreductase family membrane subunit